MRMSDWSSDVCSSDLDPASKQRALLQQARAGGVLSAAEYQAKLAALPPATGTPHAPPRGWILGLAFCVPLLVVVLYMSIGEPAGLHVVAPAVAAHACGAAGHQAMADATPGLPDRLAQPPDER